jgi:hypothetical protein
MRGDFFLLLRAAFAALPATFEWTLAGFKALLGFGLLLDFGLEDVLIFAFTLGE